MAIRLLPQLIQGEHLTPVHSSSEWPGIFFLGQLLAECLPLEPSLDLRLLLFSQLSVTVAQGWLLRQLQAGPEVTALGVAY